MMANGAIVMIRYSRTFGRDWPGETEKNSDPASETARQTSPQMLAAWVSARRANGVGSAKRESFGPAGVEAERGGVAMPGPTLSVTPRPFWVETEFILRLPRLQFRCHVSSVASRLQLRGCRPPSPGGGIPLGGGRFPASSHACPGRNPPPARQAFVCCGPVLRPVAAHMGGPSQQVSTARSDSAGATSTMDGMADLDVSVEATNAPRSRTARTNRLRSCSPSLAI